MALNSQIANFRFGKITFTDNTGSPISLELIYEPGDFSADNLMEGGKGVTDYKDRGNFQSLAYVNQEYPTWSVTAWATALVGTTGSGNIGIPDVILKAGGFAAGVSTLGAGALIPWTFDLVFALEGTDAGGADTQLAMDDNRGVLAFAEGDPSQFTISGTCYGAYAVTAP